MTSPGSWPTPTRSIRLRFALALAAFVVMAMALLATFMFLGQRQVTLTHFERDAAEARKALMDKGAAYSNFLARIAPQGILSYDYLLLEGYVEELGGDRDIAYAVILNAAGEPLTHFLKDPASSRAVPPEQFGAVLRQVRTSPDLWRVSREIEHNGTALGTVEVGLSQDRISQRLHDLRADLDRELRRLMLLGGIAILLALVLLIALVEWAFSRMVVRPIQALGAAMAQVPAGEPGARATVFREDEIGWLASRFNQMATELQWQLTHLAEQRRAYKETRDYLANILDNSGDMIVTTSLNGAIVEFNSGAERTLGYVRRELVGAPSDVIYYDRDQRERLYATVQGGTLVQDAEIRLRRSDDAPIDVQITLSPLRDNAGQIIGTVCIGRDITQAKALRSRLIQAEKLASIGQVASWIAHQIRNYLGRILMDASALRPSDTVESDKPGAAGSAYRDLSAAIHEMDRMVTDLLDYSRTLKLHRSLMKLNASIEGLLPPLLADQPDGRLKIECELAPDLPPVEADVFKIEQAFGNVLKNAVDAMPQGGTIRVSTRHWPEDGAVTVVIEDTGPGIPPEDLPKVLLPFFTTKPRGTGLGLAMVSRIVEAHGGTVSVESPPGRGARFTFVLPCKAPAEAT